jgi:hypothetical protein
VFAFTTYNDTGPKVQWEAKGIVGFEEVQDTHGLRYVVIHTLKKIRTNQVANILAELNILPHCLPFMADITSFTRKDTMQNSIFYKSIEEFKDAEDTAHTYKAWKVPRDLAMDLVLQSAKADGKRESKAPERLQMLQEPKKPRRQGFSPDEVQAKRQRFQRVADTESEEEPVSQPAVEHVALLQNLSGPVVAPPEAVAPAVDSPGPVVAPPEAVAPDVDPALSVVAPPEAVAPPVDPPLGAPVVQAVYMPNFAAVYSEANTELKRLEAHLVDKDKHLADKNVELKRMEAHLADKDKHLADKDAEIKRLQELFQLHLAEKDAALAAKSKQIDLLRSAVI